MIRSSLGCFHIAPREMIVWTYWIAFVNIYLDGTTVTRNAYKRSQ